MKQTFRFLSDGSGEIGRKMQRGKLRNQLGRLGKQRQEALLLLGKEAWNEKLDLSAYSELREQLLNLDRRQSELSATSSKLQTERAALESKRAAEIERFDSLVRPVQAKKAETESALKAARGRLSDSNRAIGTIESKLKRLASDLARLETSGAAAQPSREQLEAQRKGLSEQLAVAKPAQESQTAEVAALESESRRCREELDRINAERKAALSPIDADLRRIEQASRGTSRESTDVAREQQDRLTALGTALYDGKSQEPELAESMQAVARIDATRAETQAAMNASFALTAAMPPHTMLKFWATPVLLLAIFVLGALAVAHMIRKPEPVPYSGFGEVADSAETGRIRRTSETADADVINAVNLEESRKDATVKDFFRSPGDGSRRRAAVETLEADLMTIGSSANRDYLPQLRKILQAGEPELRAAAARAIGMIRPGASETPALLVALNDPTPEVRKAALSALGQVRDDRSVQLLVRRVQLGERSRTRDDDQRFQAEAAPDSGQLGVPIYPGAAFLHYASDLEIGRAAFSTADSPEQVLEFYSSRAARPAVDAGEFSRLYFGGSKEDPTGSNRLSKEIQEWFVQASAAGRPQTEIRAEIERRQAHMLNLPGVRYMDSSIYGQTRFLALEEKTFREGKTAARYVAVFRDEALGRTGFEVFAAP
jgi:hypothetical protein